MSLKRMLFGTLCAASVAVAVACGAASSGSNGGNGNPTTPSPIPPGCSGASVNSVAITVFPGDNVGPEQRSITVQLNGETFNWAEGGIGALNIARDFVPCDYTISGVMHGSRNGSIEFSKTPNFGGGVGGVERGSIVSASGPFLPVAGTQCKLAFTKTATEDQSPYAFSVRFRISTSNGCGTGTGMGANVTAPTP
jgi:hypothetical protein